MLFVMRRVAIETQGFQLAVSQDDQSSSGSFIGAAGFHADKAVFHQLGAANAVRTADFIQRLDDLRRSQSLSIHRDGGALFKSDGNFAARLGSLARVRGQHPNIVGHGQRWILQRAPFVADVPEVAVAAVNLLGRRGHRNLVLAGVFNGILAGLDGPVAPRADDRQMRSKGLVGQFEAHLIITLAGAAMGDRVGAFAQRHLYLPPGEQRPGDGSSQQVFVFVDRPGAHHTPEEFGDELLPHVFDENFGGAAGLGFFDDAFELLALADVAGHSNDLAAIILPQPRDDHAGVQAPGICQDDFLWIAGCGFFLSHELTPRIVMQHRLTQPSVDFPTVANVMYDNLPNTAVDTVDDPIIAVSQPIESF